MSKSSRYVHNSRLGRLFVNRGFITEQELEEALIKQRDGGVMLGEVLINDGLISQQQLESVLGHQKRTRVVGAFVAIVAAPFQPGIALADNVDSDQENLAVATQQAEKFNKYQGLQPLTDDEMSGINAQGLELDIGLAMGGFKAPEDAQSQIPHNTYFADSQSNQVQELANIAFGPLNRVVMPLTDYFDGDTSVEGISYDSNALPMEFVENGGVKFSYPTEIKRISIENLRIKGASEKAVIGSLYMSNIKFAEGSSFTIRAHN